MAEEQQGGKEEPMSNSFARGGRRESSEGIAIWSSAVYDDDDEADGDTDFDEEDEASARLQDRWSFSPGFGSPEWWSRT
jgi:hypothetical protein